MSCDDNGLVVDGSLRPLFVGDGRVWRLTFDQDITGMVGKLAIKADIDDEDVDAFVIVDGVVEILPNPETGLFDRMVFTMTDLQSQDLVLGGVNFSIRVTPFNGVTTTLINTNLQVVRTSPKSMA